LSNCVRSACTDHYRAAALEHLLNNVHKAATILYPNYINGDKVARKFDVFQWKNRGLGGEGTEFLVACGGVEAFIDAEKRPTVKIISFKYII
jgi:hypothetical protein